MATVFELSLRVHGSACSTGELFSSVSAAQAYIRSDEKYGETNINWHKVDQSKHKPEWLGADWVGVAPNGYEYHVVGRHVRD